MALLHLNRSAACAKNDRGNFWEPVLKPQDSCKDFIGRGAVGCDINSGFYVDRNLREQHRKQKLEITGTNGTGNGGGGNNLLAPLWNRQLWNQTLSANDLGLPINTNTFGSPMILVLVLMFLVLLLFCTSWKTRK